MLVTRYNPLKDFRDFENRFFNPKYYNKEVEDVAKFSPSVNTREGEYAYHIDVDLPGINKEDIRVDIKDNTLTISGERTLKEEVKEEDYFRVETSFGKFSRSFTLPENVDMENIEASSNNGVLEVVIPKLEPVETTKSITIK